jgi:hypothetical protein
MDLRGFSKRINVIADKMSGNIDKAVRTCALAVDAVVVVRTPVKTGRARANWQPSIGGPPAGLVTWDDKADNGRGAAYAIKEGQRVIATYKQGAGSIYISNNLPYIQRLNEGWSKQAPAGFVEAAVATGIQAVRDAKIL